MPNKRVDELNPISDVNITVGHVLETEKTGDAEATKISIDQIKDFLNDDSLNVAATDADGFVVQATLTEDYGYIGDSSNEPSEIPVFDIISATATLVSGTVAVNDARITTDSWAVATPSTTHTAYTGPLEWAATAGVMTFTSAGASDDAVFGYIIFI